MTSIACTPGRLSSEQRTRVIEEVNRLELQSKMRQDGTLVSGVEHEKNMDDIVRLLTDTRLKCVPNTANSLELMLDNEKRYLVR